MGPGSRCLGSEPRAPGRHRFPDEMWPVCRCARRGMPVGTGQLPLTEGLGRDFADHMGVSVCVDGVQGAGGCQGQTLPRPRQLGSPHRLRPAVFKGSPTSPLPSRKSSLEITTDSPAGQTLLQEGLPGTSYSSG